jgi:hypothetical protein
MLERKESTPQWVGWRPAQDLTYALQQQLLWIISGTSSKLK